LKKTIVSDTKACPLEWQRLTLYPIVETSDVPAGWTSVPVESDGNGEITNAAMVAGSVGMRISSSEQNSSLERQVSILSSLQADGGYMRLVSI
jgi:hypothetical protein